MMEWCHSVDCWRGSCSISSSTSIERERVSIREVCNLLVVGGEEHIGEEGEHCGCHVGLTYKR